MIWYLIFLTMLTNSEIHEALDFALSRELNFEMSQLGLITILKWNKSKRKIEWIFTYIPGDGPLMQLLTASYNNFKQTTS